MTDIMGNKPIDAPVADPPPKKGDDDDPPPTGDDPNADDPKNTDPTTGDDPENKNKKDPENKTDPEPDPNKTDDDPPTIIDDIRNRLGYEVEGDFTNDVDGVVELVQKALPQAVEQQVNQMLEEYPEARELINHLAAGYSVDTWKEQQQSRSILDLEITEDSTDLQEQIMKDQLASSGIPESQIADIIENMKEKGTLYSTSKEALKRQQQNLQTQLAQQQEAEKQQKIQQDLQAKKQWEDIRKTIHTGKVGDISIPQAKQGAFWDYLTKPVKAQDGTISTLKQQKFSNMTLEQQLALEYMVFSDFKIVPGKKTTNSLEGLANANSNRQNRLSGGGSRTDTRNEPGNFTSSKTFNQLDGYSSNDFFNN